MPSLDEGDTCVSRPRLAAVTAVHLVGQVLDEAYVIATAAKETGEPWQYSTLVRKFKEGLMGEGYNTSLFGIPFVYKSENDDANKLIDVTDITNSANTVSTSTPVKPQDEAAKMIEEFIGQGDESFELSQNEPNFNSTSMYINNLFDMREIDQTILNYDVNEAQRSPENYESLTQTVTRILESYVNFALTTALEESTDEKAQIVRELSESAELSNFSYLVDAFQVDLINRKIDNIEDDISEKNIVNVSEIIPNMIYDAALEKTANDVTQEKEETKVEYIINEQMIQNENQSDIKPDFPFYENTYLTLNRDYDQYSEDYGVVAICGDSKPAVLQEIELLTAYSSDDNIRTCTETDKSDKKPAEFAALSGVSQGSRKSSLVRRCRTQGAKILACLRGWWRRKSSKKQNVLGNSAEVRGFTALSPDARRRTASLLDQRMCLPSTSRSVIWKFNTVNETVINSDRWKNYTFELQSDECSED